MSHAKNTAKSSVFDTASEWAYQELSILRQAVERPRSRKKPSQKKKKHGTDEKDTKEEAAS